MYPTCPSRAQTPTTSEERDTDERSHGSQITTISRCLGNQLHDNLATIIDNNDSKDIDQIPELQNTIKKEKNIIQRTNDLQEYIFTDDWIQNEDQIKDYKFKRIKWVRAGEQYLTVKRKSTQAINCIIDDPMTNTRLRGIILELQ